MKKGIRYALVFCFVIIIIASCRVVKLGQFYLSENHQRPKQEKVDIDNDPSYIFKFHKGDQKTHDLISQIEYTPYSKKNEKTYKLSDYLDRKTKTTAFIVIRRDTILFEEYYEGYDEYSLLPSWSVAKSFVGALAGIAIDEGFLKKSDYAIDYMPELEQYDSKWKDLKVEHLLNMRSGIDFNEDSYSNPYSSIADLYISKNIPKLLKRIRFKYAPGSFHHYSSLDSELLTMILEKALNRPLALYLQEKIHKPIGMESPATWTIDSKRSNVTKGFCCLDLTLRDYAKFARLYLNNGRWDDKQVIDSTWIAQSVNPNFENDCYQNQWYTQRSPQYEMDSTGSWHLATYQDSITARNNIKNIEYQHPIRHWFNNDKWIIENCGPNFYALGIFGQEIYINPISEMIFIRLGKKWDTSSINIFSLISNELEKHE